MGIFSRLFGSDKVVQAGIDGIDKAFYTSEEKAEDSLKRLSMKEALLKAYEPFKIAQRYMMIIVGIPYVTAWTFAFFVGFFMTVPDTATALLEGRMGDVFYIIAGFYFGGGLIEGAVKAVKAK